MYTSAKLKFCLCFMGVMKMSIHTSNCFVVDEGVVHFKVRRAVPLDGLKVLLRIGNDL